MREIHNVNHPHCYNSTNLHTHGLWINPAGNSDNILITVRPQVKFQYEYNIPPDHPAGTFWYHPHLHGSTALQVGSGMAGALIIRGDRTPEKFGAEIATGDIDTLLRNADTGQEFKERLMVFQQIPYACMNEDGEIKKARATDFWICDQNEVGVIEPTEENGRYGAFFGPGTWPDSGRYTSVNGVVAGSFPDAEVGKIERWRLVHAGTRDTIKLKIVKLNADSTELATANSLKNKSALQVEDFINSNCTGDAVTQLSMATDGLTREFLVPQSDNTLQPGYREDLLIAFEEAGTYCVIDEASPGYQSLEYRSNNRSIIGFIEVNHSSDGTSVSSSETFVQSRLIAAAETFMPVSVQQDIIDGLNDGLQLAAFVAHETITEDEVNGQQTLSFNIDTAPATSLFQVGNLDDAGDPVNLASYDPNVINRDLILGTWMNGRSNQLLSAIHSIFMLTRSKSSKYWM